METHVDSSNVSKVCQKVFNSWFWTTNASCCTKGTRIMLGWDPNVVDVMVLSQSDQVVHTQVIFKLDKKSLFCSFVYAENHYMNRRSLWQNLCGHSVFMKDKQWALMGDFNASLFLDDSSAGTSRYNIGSREFKECINTIEVFDVNSTGLHFTWTNNHQRGGTIFKKLDRIMCNINCITVFPNVGAFFHPFQVSDHAPCILKLPGITREKPRPFKFVNLIAEKHGFLDEVNLIWNKEMTGFHMYQIVMKLKLLKTPLRKLFIQQGNLHENVKKARKELDECQGDLDQDPSNGSLLANHSRLLQRYKEAIHDEAMFLQQKSKVDWLNLGDSNTKYFHNVVKAKNHRSRILSIRDSGGLLHEGVDLSPNMDLFHNKLSAVKANNMIRSVTEGEIKEAMFSIAGNKAPDPDGYTSVFFKKAWDIVGKDVCLAIQNFFMNGKLLNQLNHTKDL
ncbi:uncharacterized protein LOC118485720 [Helianthus annuus]|uniref:uncharacterized protein LOC118485720 n=1 Tax=Helianthus annuus TaxID=4232 RepID=UPI0016532C8B|nr:uncharacterized protein LOC118485720 [Helianthus annuus]